MMVGLLEATGFEDITELDAGRHMRRGHFTRDQTIAPGNRAQKRHYTTGTESTTRGGVRPGRRGDERGQKQKGHTRPFKGPHTNTTEVVPKRVVLGRLRAFVVVGSCATVCVGEQLFAHRKLAALLLCGHDLPAHTCERTENDSSTLHKHYTTKISSENYVNTFSSFGKGLGGGFAPGVSQSPGLSGTAFRSSRKSQGTTFFLQNRISRSGTLPLVSTSGFLSDQQSLTLEGTSRKDLRQDL